MNDNTDQILGWFAGFGVGVFLFWLGWQTRKAVMREETLAEAARRIERRRS